MITRMQGLLLTKLLNVGVQVEIKREDRLDSLSMSMTDRRGRLLELLKDEPDKK